MKENKDELTIVDIGNFCLLTEKYKTQIENAGIENVSDKNEFFLNECSRSISERLKIMDDCQKMLYKNGYQKESIKQMKQLKEMFQEGVETMQAVLKAFDIAIYGGLENEE